MTRVVPADGLDAAVEAEVAPYFATAPGAVARAKRLARSLGAADRRRRRRGDGRRRSPTPGRRAEAREGIAAFLEKRPPPWADG